MVNFPEAVQGRHGLKAFTLDELASTISRAARELGGKDFELSRQNAEKVAQNLRNKYGKIVSPGQINEILFQTLIENGYDGTAWAAKIRAKQKSRAQERMKILGSTGKRSTTDAFLMVGSTSKETAKKWDRDRIVVSLINESDLNLQIASSVAEEAETYIFGADVPHITTQLIREAVHTELIRRELIDAANKYRNFGIPRADLERLIEEKIAFQSLNLEEEEGGKVAEQLNISGQTLLVVRDGKQFNLTNEGFM